MTAPESQAVLTWLTEWRILPDEDRIVMTPEGDLMEHDTAGDCVCGPYIEHLGGRDWLYVHHSLDGREKHEGG